MKKIQTTLIVSLFVFAFILLLGFSKAGINPLTALGEFLGYWSQPVAEEPQEEPADEEPVEIPEIETKPLFELPIISFKNDDVKQFKSKQEFVSYLEENESESGYYGIGMGMAKSFAEPMIAMEESADFSIDSAAGMGGSNGTTPSRVSETNVQVKGIDEPDIIKVNDKQIYYSGSRERYYTMRDYDGLAVEKASYKEPTTDVFTAFPVKDLDFLSEIEKTGELLIADDILMVLHWEGVYAYDISNPAEPEKAWELEYKNNSWLESARLMNDELYLIVKKDINRINPCPIFPFENVEIACTSIYYPEEPISAEITYHAFKVDTKTGKVTADISFVGSYSNSVTYMSPDNLYIAFTHQGDIISKFINFFETKATDLVSSSIVSRIKKVDSYDISRRAKNVEIESIWSDYANSMDKDDALTFENEINNRFSDYYKKNLREFQKTSIARISLNDFKVKANGSVPGQPLNQFCLDEYEKNLRIATTIGEGWWGIWFRGINIPNSETANDVYILDQNLNKKGSIIDLGLTERIYSARFIGDKGYLVTFRQIDPFYVLDLKNPSNPKVAGELKIPGYSGYLHPLSEDKILGLGQEGSTVKISLFDVSDPYNPKEIDKYILKEYWSEAVNNHHAFLLDKDHEVFFMPAKNAYIFSYKGDKLTLEKAVSQQYTRRAVYLDDYMYIFHNDGITVLDESNWEKIKEFEF